MIDPNPNIPQPPKNDSIPQADQESAEALNPDALLPPDLVNELSLPGALEVETMSASRELQERRTKVKESSMHELDHLGETTESYGESSGEASSTWRSLLREANLSPKHLKFCCFGLLLFAGIFGLAFWGIGSILNDDATEELATEEEEAQENEQDQGVAEEDYEETINKALENSIKVALLVGDAKLKADEGTQTGAILGEGSLDIPPFAEAMQGFGSLYELMEIDVPDYLNQSRDREQALQAYQDELNYLRYKSGLNLEDLQNSADALAESFVEAEQEKNQLEERFFDNFRAFDGYGTQGVLDEFIIASESLVRLKAQFNAVSKLIAYYEIGIEAAELRLRDIELNEEALIKGIKVVDIEGSDLDLIIEEAGL